MTSGKAAGPDGLPAVVVKELGKMAGGDDEQFVGNAFSRTMKEGEASVDPEKGC